MKQRDFTSARAKEALLKDKDEKYCGNCCWFYAEDTYGFGACTFQFAEVRQCDRPCNSEENFTSREEMRHHLAVLLKDIRWDKDTDFIHYSVDGDEATKAKEFAYKYIKTFSKL